MGTSNSLILWCTKDEERKLAFPSVAEFDLIFFSSIELLGFFDVPLRSQKILGDPWRFLKILKDLQRYQFLEILRDLRRSSKTFRVPWRSLESFEDPQRYSEINRDS